MDDSAVFVVFVEFEGAGELLQGLFLLAKLRERLAKVVVVNRVLGFFFYLPAEFLDLGFEVEFDLFLLALLLIDIFLPAPFGEVRGLFVSKITGDLG